MPTYKLNPNDKERKGIYIVPFDILRISQSAQAWITQFYLQIYHAGLSNACVHQMVPALTQVKDIQLQLSPFLGSYGRKLAWVQAGTGII